MLRPDVQVLERKGPVLLALLPQELPALRLPVFSLLLSFSLLASFLQPAFWQQLS